MKWLKKIWSLFVDDPKLALLALVALAVGAILAHSGIRQVAGFVIFLLVSLSLFISVRSN